MARKLFDLNISELTLCKSPSNKKLFFIRKSKEVNVDTLIEKLKQFLAESDEDVEKVLTSEQVERIEKLDSKVQKEMEENLDVVLLYEDVPDDLENVHKFAFKQIIDQLETEEVGKAGAKLSKTTQAQIKEALGHIKDGPKAVAILESLLGVETKKTVKGKEGDEENLSVETIERLERLGEFEKKEKEDLSREAEKKQAEKVLEIVNKALKDSGLEEIAQKTSIGGQDEHDKDKKKETKKGADDDEDKFPSIPIPVLGD